MPRLAALTACLVTLAFAGNAAAEPTPVPLDDEEPGAPAPILLPSPSLAPRAAIDLGVAKAPDAKSPGVALGLSLGGYLVPTAVGLTMLFAGRTDELRMAGMVVGALGASLGPSLGHFYTGNVGRGVLTSLGRGGLITGSVFMCIAGAFSYGDKAGGLIAGGAVLAAGAFALTLWDLIDAPFAARRANAQRGFAFAPILNRDQSGAMQAGLAVGGRF
jgi:hypothetical protein